MRLNWELVIGGFGLLLAIVSLILQQRREGRVEDLQSRLAAIEELRRAEEIASRKQADVWVRFDSEHNIRGRNWFLVLGNSGSSEARKITFELSDPRGGRLPELMMEDVPSPLPVLHTDQDYRVRAVVTMGVAGAFTASVAWEDDEGRKDKQFALHL